MEESLQQNNNELDVIRAPSSVSFSHSDREQGPRLEAELLFSGGVAVLFRGKDRDYQIEIYRSGCTKDGFLGLPEYSGLEEIVRGLYLGIYPDRDRDLSIARMKQGLSHPRTILELVRYEGVPVGFGIFPRLLVSGEPVVYSSRAFELEHEGQGLGTHVLKEAIRLHQESLAKSHRSLRWGALMTQNALSVLTLQKIPMVEIDYPFRRLFSEDREAQSLMLGVHREVYLSSLSIDTTTGVSRGELRELGMNEAYRPNRDHQKAWAIHQRMVSLPPHGFGMNREAGDVVYVLFKLRKPNFADTSVAFLPEAA
ncbi:hypothetical protein A3I48_03575 [Candidatus Daviesbacteria bacterium RIFCSPLOWO2_02_FULL_36_7]|uniref:Uncharacterized protein n=1 Tax=Candidatus Daviesbacteria bacterium RIFCSPLOWO2_02_FULL_36_7 TaxID=1797792 RepID=A0A1F5MGN5_9BACT|nr:MAG: hypothetical protein A3I48_03575 [Candidatus Daviesbacteria bacterium RIFCSPLOWO2_02_FULL_36_7]